MDGGYLPHGTNTPAVGPRIQKIDIWEVGFYVATSVFSPLVPQMCVEMRMKIIHHILSDSFLIFFIFCLCPCLSVPWSIAGDISSSERCGVMTVREALTTALSNNLDIRAASLQPAAEREQVEVEKGVFDPSLEISGGTGEGKDPTSLAFSRDGYDRSRTTDGAISISKRFSVGLDARVGFETSRNSDNSRVDDLNPRYGSRVILDLTQPILRDFGVPVNTAAIRIGENRFRQAAFEYEDRAFALAEEVEGLYIELAMTREILGFRRESRMLAERLLEANREKFAAGLVPITEVQEAETAVAARDEALVAAEEGVETAMNTLWDRLGGQDLSVRPHECPIVPEPLAPVPAAIPAYEEMLAVAMERRPDLAFRKIEVETRDIHLAYTKNQRLPRLDIEATFAANGLSGESQPIEFGGLPETSTHVGSYRDALSRMAEVDGYEWYTGLRFTYPIGNRAANALYARSSLEKEQSILLLHRLEKSIETDVKNALVSLKKARERVGIADRFVSLADTTLSQEMERFREGLSDTFRILRYQEDLVDARIRRVSALADFHKGLSRLGRACGTILERHGITFDRVYVPSQASVRP